MICRSVRVSHPHRNNVITTLATRHTDCTPMSLRAQPQHARILPAGPRHLPHSNAGPSVPARAATLHAASDAPAAPWRKAARVHGRSCASWPRWLRRTKAAGSVGSAGCALEAAGLGPPRGAVWRRSGRRTGALRGALKDPRPCPVRTRSCPPILSSALPPPSLRRSTLSL